MTGEVAREATGQDAREEGQVHGADGADGADGVRTGAPPDADRPVRRPRRPASVTATVWITVAGAVLDLVLAVLLLAGPSATGPGDPGSVEAHAVVGWAEIVLALAQVLLAVGLARGSNAARLVLTLVLVARQAYAWVLVAGLGDGPGRVLLGLAVSALVLVLLWNRKATAFFERRDERVLGAMSVGQPVARRGAGRLALDYLARLVLLALTVLVTPGVSTHSGLSLALGVVGISVAGWLLRPVFDRVAVFFGWLGAITLALFANTAVLGLGFVLTPGFVVDGILPVIIASWIYGAMIALLTWAFSVNNRDYLMVHAVRMSRRAESDESAGAPGEPVPGVIFVQLDGLPAPLLENEIRSGNLPTISRWVRSGSHTWTEWTARVPSTTPVSQAGLLHGRSDGIPAFRWFDRGLGRLLVGNRPEDAAVIEERISDGHGLLADEGVSISNLFSGDAPTSLLTMSGLRLGSTGLGPSTSYAAFFTHPAGFARALVMTVGEMVKEVFQSRRQQWRQVEPRIHRRGSYIVLRAVTNVLLRDLNVALVVEAMMDGAKSVYVDFVDYDEIAHHAGVTRPESLASLVGLDDVLRTLESVARSGVTPRSYHFVLLSDHGQSQGATFRQRYGQTLEDLVRQHLSGGETVGAATGEVEAYGPVNILLTQLAGQDSVTARLAQRALRDRDDQEPLGPGGPGGPAATADDPASTDGSGTGRPDLVVVGSGNLGGIWFAQQPERLGLAEIVARHPGLLPALAGHPGIAFVVVRDQSGPVALSGSGRHELTTGVVEGEDPMAPFGPQAVADFARAAEFANAPDIYVNSLYDPVLDEVAAFEELVGCHGGVGGWQTRPMLVHPTEWAVDADLRSSTGLLVGADVVHHQLVRWLERLGHRTDLPDPRPRR